MYPNIWGHMRKMKDFLKKSIISVDTKKCGLAVICININSMVCICYDIKHYESISSASKHVTAMLMHAPPN